MKCFKVYEFLSVFGALVQSKYAVAVGQTTLLVMVPSHIPQCVEIFNGKNSEIGLLRKN